MPLGPSCRFLRRRTFALLPILLCATPLLSEEPEPDLSWINREAVAAGMVFYETERGERPLWPTAAPHPKLRKGHLSIEPFCGWRCLYWRRAGGWAPGRIDRVTDSPLSHVLISLRRALAGRYDVERELGAYPTSRSFWLQLSAGW